MNKTFGSSLLLIALAACPAFAQQPRTASSGRPSAPEVTPLNATGAAADVLALDKKIGEAIVAGDVAFFTSVTADDFSMTHGAQWTQGRKPTATDTKQSFLKRVTNKSYAVYDLGPLSVEMHGDVAIVYGRYIANIPKGRAPDMTWFACWFVHIYAKRDGKWTYLSHRTVYGPTYGPTRESVNDK